MAGFKANPNVAAIWVAIANFVGTAIALRLVDRIGRRTLLLRATAAATVALALLALALGQIDTGLATDGTAKGLASRPSAWTYVCLLSMVFFLFFYALGLGIVPWLVQSEVFSGSIRGIGGGVATATNWCTNLLTSATFLDLMRFISPQGCFWLYSAVGVVTFVFAYTQLPELAGMSINDVQAALEGSLHASTEAQDRAYTALPRHEHGEANQDDVFGIGDDPELDQAGSPTRPPTA